MKASTGFVWARCNGKMQRVPRAGRGGSSLPSGRAEHLSFCVGAQGSKKDAGDVSPYK
jgi:hypothetical protein